MKTSANSKTVSSSHAAFSIQESARHYMERGDCLKAVMLDSAKAFDTVWHDGLLWKLNDLGISEAIWRVLCHCYAGMKSCVLVNNTRWKCFHLHRGGYQGSVLSTKLYLLYINAVLDNLSSAKKEAMIFEVHVASPTQGNNVTLPSPLTTHLQNMVDICQEYSAK